jgi:nitrogen fixation protein FixH
MRWATAMSPTLLSTARRREGMQGRHVLGAFLGFFVAIFVMNGALIYAAISTNAGPVANEPYRKGLHYNDRIAADARQASLGWTETVDVGRDGRVRIDVAGPGGRAVSGLVVSAVLGRPSTQRQDIQLKLTEMGPGRYEARVAALPAGTWLIALEARTAADAEPVYRSRRRLWLDP